VGERRRMDRRWYHPTVSNPSQLPPPFASLVHFGRMLVGGKPATLSWTGSTVRLNLRETGEQIFDLTPAQIKRVRDDQRMTLVFTAGRSTYHVAFPDVAPGFAAGASLGMINLVNNTALTSPVNAWLLLFRALGIRVGDNTLILPQGWKVAVWTMFIFTAVLVLIFSLGFVGLLSLNLIGRL